MTARFTNAEIARAAKVAAEAGVSVTLEAPDGRKVIVAPVDRQPESPQDKRTPEPWNCVSSAA